jgi:hypothetical protein
MNLGDSFDDILRKLRGQAVVQFGEARASKLEESLEETAQQIWQMDQVTPHVDLEPGFYQ